MDYNLGLLFDFFFFKLQVVVNFVDLGFGLVLFLLYCA